MSPAEHKHQPTVGHLFYDVNMGCGSKGMLRILEANTGKESLEHGEVAVYINRRWTGVKILTSSTGFFYYKDPNDKTLTVEDIRIIPTLIGGPRLTFQKNLEAALLKQYNNRFSEEMKRLAVAHA